MALALIILIVIAVVVVLAVLGALAFASKRSSGGIPVAAVAHPDKTADIVSALDSAGIKCDVCQDPTSDMWQVKVAKKAEGQARDTLRGYARG